MPQRGATAADLAQAQSATPDGWAVFESYCAECHGARGAGNSQHPAVVGDRALGDYPSARELHAYVEGHLPKLNRRGLGAADYWAVVSFIAVANGAPVPVEGVSESNAGVVKLHEM